MIPPHIQKMIAEYPIYTDTLCNFIGISSESDFTPSMPSRRGTKIIYCYAIHCDKEQLAYIRDLAHRVLMRTSYGRKLYGNT